MIPITATGWRSWLFRSGIYWLLFLSSYAPLFLILALRAWNHWYAVFTLTALLVASICLLEYALYSARALAPRTYSLRTVQDRNADITAYIASYIVPLMLIDFTHWPDVVALTVLLLVVGRIYVTSHLIFVNPTLNLLGYGIYEFTDIDNQIWVLLSKKQPIEGPIKAHTLARSVLIEAKS